MKAESEYPSFLFLNKKQKAEAYVLLNYNVNFKARHVRSVTTIRRVATIRRTQ